MRGNLLTVVVMTAFTLAAVSCVTPRNGMGQSQSSARSTTAAAAPDQPAPKGGDKSGSILGSWSGAIVAAGQNIGVHISFTESEGTIQGKIDIPEQAAFGLPLVHLDYNPPHLSFALNAGSDMARFQGTLQGTGAGAKITGTFQQGPVAGTFSISHSGSGGEKPAESPLSTSPSGGEGAPIELHTPTGTIAGTLDLPPGRGPFPVALIIAGSGPTNRNGNSPLIHGKNNSLLMVARVLKQHGIASVRYDKRGIGESAAAMPKASELRFSVYIDDAASWIDLLRHDPRFTKIAVIGHSQGSLIGMIAARIAGADAFVSIAGPGFPAGQIIKEQLAQQPLAIRTEADSIIASLEAGREVKDVSPGLMTLFRPSIQPYLISWFQYDPRKEIAQLTIPVLILQGTHDLQVSVKDAEALHAAQPRSTLEIIQGMNHIMKDAPANRQENIATYGNPDIPLAPQLVKDLTSFLKSVT